MDQKQTPEEKFRDSLLDVVAFLEKLAPLVDSTADLLATCELGLQNAGQLKLIMLAAGSKLPRI